MKKTIGHIAPGRLFLVLTASAFVSEAIIMMVLERVTFSTRIHFLVDGLAIALIMGAIMFFLVFRPMKARLETIAEQDEEIRHTKEHLEDIQYVTSIGSYDNNLLTGEQFWSKSLYSLLGYGEDVAPTDENLTRVIHRGDLGTIGEHVELARKTGETLQVEFGIHKADSGEEITVRSQGHFEFDSDGTPIRAYGYLQDITLQKQAENIINTEMEKNNQSYLDNPTALFETDISGRIINVNRAFAGMYGYSVDELIGLDASSFYANSDDRDQLIKEISEKGAVRNWPIESKNRDGTSFSIRLSARVVNGVILGYVSHTGANFLPICAHCKAVRPGGSSSTKWVPLEDYMTDSLSKDLSHGICDPCAKIHYAEFLEEDAL
ncbi:MAG: PAS domain-containing protein [Desulfobacterales bacterium]